MNKYQIKSIGAEIVDVDTTGNNVILYASKFGNEDSHGDIMAPSAYDKTIKENGPSGKNRIAHLWQHDTKEPIGKPVTMESDDYGLKIHSKISKTQRGKDALILYVDGVINEHSVGFFTMKDRINKDSGTRTILETHLLEYSSVTHGSNEYTPTLAVKSLEEKADYLAALNKRSQKLYKAFTTGNLTDETCELLALEHVQINKAMNDLIESLKSQEPEIIITTPEVIEPIKVITAEDIIAAFTKGYNK
ncbi:HK97 family phage prohead protease [Hymenobacter sp. NBH84]|uniref:HK97 family phage prohead protease n=1 Tax=Hymenobacter sp. NBH84 TaxID=2596915 RepID=UPI00162AF60D|nr:HK97 family phage prohead protease [Hymenobacter sp. NBH84]QNE38985.1 HK97 family phage prohead protease [Hymenobacter sp. NBH84]